MCTGALWVKVKRNLKMTTYPVPSLHRTQMPEWHAAFLLSMLLLLTAKLLIVHDPTWQAFPPWVHAEDALLNNI